MDINIRFMEQYNMLNNNNYLFLELMKITGLNKFTILKLFNLFNLRKNIFVYEFKQDPTKNELFIKICKKLFLFVKIFVYQEDKIKIKKLIYNYQGYRHKLSLPCRGQGTKRNGKTQKKKRKNKSMNNKFLLQKFLKKNK